MADTTPDSLVGGNMSLKDLEARRAYKREWERKKLADPEYRKLHNDRKAAEHRKFRKANPEKIRTADRRDWLSKAYGVTPEWFNAKLAEQNKVCAICLGTHKQHHWRSGKVEPLHVDHDHRTEMARGLLCTHCNKFLGQVEKALLQLSNPVALPGTWMEKALQYLKSYGNDSLPT